MELLAGDKRPAEVLVLFLVGGWCKGWVETRLSKTWERERFGYWFLGEVGPFLCLTFMLTLPLQVFQGSLVDWDHFLHDPGSSCRL